MIERLQHDVGWLHIALNCLRLAQKNEEKAEVWIWGDRGVWAVTIVDGIIEGRFASIEIVQNAHGWRLRDVYPTIEAWAVARGARHVAGNSPRMRGWDRLLPGFRPVSVTYAKACGHA